MSRALFSPVLHGTYPGASDELLGAGFIILCVLAAWYILRGKRANETKDDNPDQLVPPGT